MSSKKCILILLTTSVFVTCLYFKRGNKEPDKYTDNQIKEVQNLNSGRNYIQSKTKASKSSRHGWDLLPDASIVGATKCGTSALHFFIAAHPDVHATQTRQIFSRHFNDKLPDMLESNIPVDVRNSFIIEKSPCYWVESFENPEYSLENIRKAYSKYGKPSKLILVACDPYVRCLSLYASKLANGKMENDVSSFESFVVNKSTGQLKAPGYPFDGGLYDLIFPNWMRKFERNHIHVVDGSTLISDPYIEVKKVEQFLGLRDFIKHDMFTYNSTKGFFCRTVEGESVCLPPRKGKEHAKVSPELTQRIQNFFMPHSKNFSRIINQWFSWSK